MKRIFMLAAIAVVFTTNSFAQLREAGWFALGLENVSGSYKGISPVFVDDSYKLNNYMTCTYQSINQKNFLTVDISGIFYPIITEMVKASQGGEAYNLRAYTNQSAQKIANRISFAFSISKFLGNNDGRFVSAFGWQANTRLFGLTEFRTKKKLDMVTDSPDAGPISGRRTLNVGVNYQLMHQAGKNLFLRTGIYGEGMLGFTKGVMVYPEASAILNWRFLALIGSARYEVAYLNAKPRTDYVYYANRSTITQALRLNVSLAFDLDWRNKKKK